MTQAIGFKKQIIWFDECTFTSQTFPKTAFWTRGQNISFTDKQLQTKRLNLLLAISKEFGVESSLIFDQPLNSKMFCELR